MVDTLDDPCRIPQPMIREGWLDHGAGSDRSKRGAEPFVAVSWDEASRIVARELARVIAEHGNRAIFAGSYGWASAGQFHHAPSQLRRFLNCIGGHTYKRDTYSLAAGEVILPHVIGAMLRLLPFHTSWPSIIEHADLVVAFGGLPVKNAQINNGGTGRHVQRDYMREAADAGVAFVNVSPLRGDVLPDLGSQWVAPRPNTDVALMLGLAHTLYAEGLHDESFLEKYTVGFERFVPLPHGSGGRRRQGRGMGGVDHRHRRADPAGPRPAHGGGTHDDFALMVPDPAGPRRAAVLDGGDACRDARPDRTAGRWRGVRLFGDQTRWGITPDTSRAPRCRRAATRFADFIPVARISDLLLNPGGEFDYNGRRYTYPDTRIVWWAGGNPFHHHQDLNRMLRAWHRPETIIVNDAWWNPMARHADIVLPCTSPLERDDLAGSPRDGYLFASRRVVEPYREARDDFAIFCGIARELGVESEYTEDRDVDEWLRHLYDVTRQRASERAVEMPSFDEFRARGVFKVPDPERPVVMLEAFRSDPEANPAAHAVGTDRDLQRAYRGASATRTAGDTRGGTSPVNGWAAPAPRATRCTSSPTSRRPGSTASSTTAGTAVPARSTVASRRGCMPPMRRRAASWPAIRSVVFNDRGACLASAVLSEDIRQGVVQLSTGAWFDPEVRAQPGAMCKHGNPNVLTPDKGTSRLAQGPIAHTCLVEVERFEGEPPPVTAFEPPEMLWSGGVG